MGRWKWFADPYEPGPEDRTGPATAYPGRSGAYLAEQSPDERREQIGDEQHRTEQGGIEIEQGSDEQKRARLRGNRGSRWRAI
ncbi:hypothetical protein [Micromonospora sp. NBC_01796]|uniref:hypothetical protein n=1 Tax=Micromonospora sp. NBC_01796 TaxID=2975987 RepID=UPI002DDC6459|nr:hypothetical protein [Micromonospora sp. NBC_01796]WSA88592.1 hypothetical protein OIE47_13855 [Micromonospora sp. NBC_01796]